MASRWSDLDRPPLSAARVARAVAGYGWPDLRLVEETGSTNADVATALQDAPGSVALVAEAQTAGRGRLGRRWVAPPRSSVLLSAGLRPVVSQHRWSLLPLVAGCAAADAIDAVAGLHSGLKWPNDLLLPVDGIDRKVGGILVERVDSAGGPAVVIGVGINVTLRADELPVEGATSIGLAGGITDREPLVVELLRSLDRLLRQWSATGGEPDRLLQRFRERCVTIGTDVTIDLPDGSRVTGRATDVDETGQLVVIDERGEQRSWSAGDVTHLRPRRA